jgi:FAD:protein FMN transferase
MSSLRRSARQSLCAVLVLLLPLHCGKHPRDPIVRETTAMNTYVNITVYDDAVGTNEVNAALEKAVAEINRFEGLASDYIDTSQIGRTNQAAGRESVAVSHEVQELVKCSLEYCRSSGGAFDITIGPLKVLWDFLAANPRVPSPENIAQARALVDYRRVVLNGNKLYLPQKGMALDLGAIGKGYAIERALEVLSQAGVRRMIVDIGGKLGVRWDGTSGLDSGIATVSVRHPRKVGEFLGSFRYGTGAVATSGDYERYFFVDGKRYHHLLDPSTGYPLRGVVSVTITAPSAVDADALSTVVFLLGREKGMAYLRNTPHAEGMIVYESGDSLGIDLSPGFQGKFLRTGELGQ